MLNSLFFNKQSGTWNDGCPTASGRLATMLWGTQDKEILSLNNENLWTGNYINRECEEGAKFLPSVRDYLLKGQNFKATALAAIAFGGNGGISPLLRRLDSYQPSYDLCFSNLGSFENRTLDIEKGIAYANHSSANLLTFCHSIDDKIVTIVQPKKSCAISLTIEREKQTGVSLTSVFKTSEILVSTTREKGINFTSHILINTDGKAIVSSESLTIVNATYIITITDIISEKEREIAFNIPQDIKDYVENHAKYFSSIFNQWNLYLEDENTKNLEKLSIEERVENLKSNKEDPALVSLFARFGIYLFISASITAKLPLHLQGKWNREVFPKWNSDYHLNINLQMNYWFSDALALDDYTKQMTDYILSLMPKARIAAQKLYGCRGIMLALNSDYYRNITTEAYNYAVWIGGAGWFTLHFYKHYLQTGNLDYLRNYAYPFIKEAATFYQDYVVINEENEALIMPSQSPENRYEGCGYFPVSMCINSAMDKQICHDTLTIATTCAKLLNLESPDTLYWEKILNCLPECGVGKDGRLLEWNTDDKIELEKGHRHFSHLYGVYPSNQFTPKSNIKQYEAAKKSLEYRLLNDGGYTGWSLAWSACLYARFLEGDKVNQKLTTLITSLASSTLLDLHPNFFPEKEPPKKGKDDPFLFGANKNLTEKVFQIDGNLGSTAAVIEALIQYRDGVTYLLPAKASSWKKGEIGPIRMDDGNKVKFSFVNNTITKLEVIFGYKEQIKLYYNNSTQLLKGEKDSIKTVL